MKRIDLTSPEYGSVLSQAGFARITSAGYLRVTRGDVLQRILVQSIPRHGMICNLTIHPLWARAKLRLEILEPGFPIGDLCKRAGLPVTQLYERTQAGVEHLIHDIHAVGLPWFDETATAEGILASAESFSRPWWNRQHTHVEFGHVFLRAGRLADAREVFGRKPSRVQRYKTLTKWIQAEALDEIAALHAEWIEQCRQQLIDMGVAPDGA